MPKIKKNIDKKTLSMGRAFLHAGRYSAAKKIYIIALKEADKNKRHLFYNGLANVHRASAGQSPTSKKLYLKAIGEYKKAIKTAPRGFPVGLYWSNLSAAYAGLKKWKEAIKTGKYGLKILLCEESNGIKHSKQIQMLICEIKLYKIFIKKPYCNKQ